MRAPVGHRPAALIAAVVVLAALVASCGPSARAQDIQGRFKLVFELPKLIWKTSEPIEGQATLSLIGTDGAYVSGSGSGLVAFGFVEIGGSRHMDPAWRLDCRSYRIEASQPMVWDIHKSGGFSSDDPNADFYRAFFADPLVHLPAGVWETTAVASFYDGEGCPLPGIGMRAPLVIRVVP